MSKKKAKAAKIKARLKAIEKANRCSVKGCKDPSEFKISVDTGVVQQMCERHVVQAFRGYLQSVLKYNRGVYVQNYKEVD